MRWLPLILLLACDPGTPADGDTGDTGEGTRQTTAPPVFLPLGDPDAELPTVERVEVPRYLGIWYEIATYPIVFQRDCARTTATYGIREEGGLTVYNQCRFGGLDGDPIGFSGKALPTDDTNSKLDVSFFGDNGAPYWIIELDGRDGDAPYDWVMISDPTRETLWILHRAPQMDDALLDPLLSRLRERGYDTDALSFTEQPATAYDPVASP